MFGRRQRPFITCLAEKEQQNNKNFIIFGDLWSAPGKKGRKLNP
jgi:hypothetical protein